MIRAITGKAMYMYAATIPFKPANLHKASKMGIVNTEAPRMTGPHSINTIKSDQNVHLSLQVLNHLAQQM